MSVNKKSPSSSTTKGSKHGSASAPILPIKQGRKSIQVTLTTAQLNFIRRIEVDARATRSLEREVVQLAIFASFVTFKEDPQLLRQLLEALERNPSLTEGGL
jgi:hypothetical protein